MRTRTAQTLTQKQARFGAMLCVFIIAALYVFEYSGADISKQGPVSELTGKITRCGDQRIPKAERGKPGATDYLFIDTTGDRAYRYDQPKSFRARVSGACRSRAAVRVFYRSYEPPLYDWTGYTLVGLVDEMSGTPYFSPDDYRAWEAQNHRYASITLVVTIAALVYLVLVWRGVIGNRDAQRIKRGLRVHDADDGRLVIRSTARNGDAWAFLFLFTGLTVWIGMEVYAGRHVAFLLAVGVTLVAAYAYLVDVVNANYIVLDQRHLISFSRPLPWLSRPVVIPIEEIAQFVGSEELQTTSQGSVINYRVSARLRDQPDPLHLFYTRDLAEAKAVAELGNEWL